MSTVLHAQTIPIHWYHFLTQHCSFKRFRAFLPQQHSLPGVGPRDPRSYTPDSSLCCVQDPLASPWKLTQTTPGTLLTASQGVVGKDCTDCSCTTSTWLHQQSTSGIWCRANCITNIPQQKWACLKRQFAHAKSIAQANNPHCISPCFGPYPTGVMAPAEKNNKNAPSQTKPSQLQTLLLHLTVRHWKGKHEPDRNSTKLQFPKLEHTFR